MDLQKKIEKAIKLLQTTTEKTFGEKYSVYDVFVGTLFYKSMTQYKYSQSGMFGKVDPKEFIENYFNVKI